MLSIGHVSKRLTQTLLTQALLAGAAISLAACSQPDHAAKVAAVAAAPTDAGTPARVRLLTSQQYANMIADLFGADIKPGTPLAPLRRTDGLLASGASSAGVTAGDLMKLQRAASAVATQVVDNGNLERDIPSHRDSLVPCKPKTLEGADDACATKFITSTGRLLFRRPLTKDKIAEFVDKVHKAAESNKDFYTGLSGVLEGMLVDPMVLMIADTTEADPKHPGQRRLDAYSLASRLSFFLWNTVPDDAVLKAAETGEILTPKGRARVVDMMLASPRLDMGVRSFFDDMFAFDDFDNLSKDSTIYPVVTGTALKEAREQTLRTVVDHLVTQHKDYRDLFTTRHTFMSPALAAVYQVATKPGWTPYDFPATSPRAGILTHVSFLTVHSHPARSSVTLRGKALRELFLCQRVPPPPPNVDFSALEDPKSPFKTARERVTFHLKNPVCAGCHKIMDPMGLALENFDGGGQFRADEKGAAIDTSGILDGKEFKDLAGLGVVLHDHPQLPQCLVKRVYSYGSGGPLTAADDAQVASLDKTFAAAGYRMPELMRAIAVSDAFTRIIDAPAPQTPAAKSASAPATTAPAAQ